MRAWVVICMGAALSACAFDPSGAAGDLAADASPFEPPAANIDAAAVPLDAAPADARTPPDATPAPDAPPPDDDRQIACGLLTCAKSCCFTPPALYQCDLTTCGGALRLCDGPEDCEAGEDCCSKEGETACAPEGSCSAEVCHEVGTCTSPKHDECALRDGEPYPICFDD